MKYVSRYFPLVFAAAVVGIMPFCYARAVPIQLPPMLEYAGSSREQEREKAQASNASCTLCTARESHALQSLLVQYKHIAGNGGWPVFPSGTTLRPGSDDTRIPGLRRALAVMGDTTGTATASSQYDAGLEDAVKHFQERHGLNADGVVGASTQAALAVSVEQRITQIMATLGRMRESPLPQEPKFILVNLPAYSLYGVEQGKATVSMRVIIGNRDNHTPLFDNAVTDVVFNPPWSVPARIARNELVPKLRENPSYFIQAGFTVTQDGVAIDPMAADPDSGDFSFRQRPGHGNALGKIKFNIPNDDNIYLHSTSSPQLFAKEDRALSHGCIRLEKPRDLAYFVLGSEPEWDKEQIDAAYDSNSQRHVEVDEIPVHLVYWTAFVDEHGTPHFYNDVYDKDATTTARLDTLDIMVMASK